MMDDYYRVKYSMFLLIGTKDIAMGMSERTISAIISKFQEASHATRWIEFVAPYVRQ